METEPKKLSIVCNVAFTKYEIVKHVASSIFGWKLSNNEEDDKWDVLWTDSAVPPEKLAKMQPFQKINHFPGMYSVSRKNYLAMNLTKLKKQFPEDYNFFPKSWLYPCDLSEIKNFMISNKNPYLIVKPEASCQGRGIFLTKKIENIDPNSRFVVQEYLARPYLIENLKFDLRIYALVAGCDPLRIFVHEAGLTRFATEEYSKPTKKNCEEMCMHLTNYAVNKNNPNFVHCEEPDDESGHKRSLNSTFEHLENEGFDVEKLKGQIDDAIIKTLCSIQPTLAHHYKSCRPEDLANGMCFEVLGFDVILDSSARPFVLEVNHTPSFTTDSPLDWEIKKQVIKDALVLMNISSKDRKSYLKKQKEIILKRAVTGKLEKDTREEKSSKIAEMKIQRDLWESKHSGGFRKIYPLDNEEKYRKYLAFAFYLYQDWTCGQAKKKSIDKQIQAVKTVKEIKRRNIEVTNNRCNSIAALASPFSKAVADSAVFERLSKPQEKKYKGLKQPIFPPLVHYDEVRKTNYYFLQSSRSGNKKNESRKVLGVSGFREVKLFEFPAERTYNNNL